jgi:hypothetical protein
MKSFKWMNETKNKNKNGNKFGLISNMCHKFEKLEKK